MKTESFTWVCANSKWRSLAVSVVVLIVVWLGVSSSAAQNAKAKRITSVQVSDTPQGARVTVVADLSLTDYEAFRRGDRFYVKLPGSDLASGQPGFRGSYQAIAISPSRGTAGPSTSTQDGRDTDAAGSPANAAKSARDIRTAQTDGAAGATEHGGSVTKDPYRNATPTNPPTDNASGAGPTSSSSVQPETSSTAISTPTPGSIGDTTTQNVRSSASGSPARINAPLLGFNRTTVENWLLRNWRWLAPVGLVAVILIVILAVKLWRPRSHQRRVKTRTNKERTRGVQSIYSENPDSIRVEPEEPIRRVTRAANRTDAVVQAPNHVQDLPDAPTEVAGLSPLPEVKESKVEPDNPKTPTEFERAELELKKLLAGREYDASLIDVSDSAMRQVVAAGLIGALASRSFEQHESARRALIDYGYFDETTRDLRTAESPTERAAAARKLGVIRDSRGIAHLIAALYDPAPEVRRAAVESLGQAGDNTAIEPLNELLQRESSRLLPEAVIRHAINSITVTEVKRTTNERPALRVVENTAREDKLKKPSEDLHGFAESLRRDIEVQAETHASVAPTVPVLPPPPVVTPPPTVDSKLTQEQTQLQLKEQALQRAAEELQRRSQDVEAARQRAEAESRLSAEREAQESAEVEAHIRVEEEARQRAEEERVRKLEDDSRLKSEQKSRAKAEDEARVGAEEIARFRLEAETLRRAAGELARKRAEAELARKIVEEEARRRAEGETRDRVEAQARLGGQEAASRRSEEEIRRKIEVEMRRRVEEEIRLKIDQERIRAEVEAQIRAEETRESADEATRIADAVEGAVRKRGAQESSQFSEDEKGLLRGSQAEGLVHEAEERRLVEEEQFRLEQEALLRAADDIARRRREIEAARKKVEEEAQKLFAVTQLQIRTDEARRLADEEQQRTEIEVRRRTEEERGRFEEARQRAREEQKRIEELAQQKTQEEAKRLAAAQDRIRVEEEARLAAIAEQKRLEEVAKRKAEEEALLLAAARQRIAAEEQARKAAEAERLRLETEAHRRAEVERRQLEETRERIIAEQKRIEDEIRHQKEQEQQRLAELQRVKQQAEEQLRQREEQEKRIRAEIESLLRTEEEQRLRIEAETRRRSEAEARLRGEHQTRQVAEEYARRIQEEDARLQAEREARLRADGEAERQAQLRAEDEERLSTRKRQQEAEQKASQIPEQSSSDLVLDTTGDVFEGLSSATMDADPVEDLRADLDVAHKPETAAVSTPAENRNSQLFKSEPDKEIDLIRAKTPTVPTVEPDISVELLHLLNSEASVERAAALSELAKLGGEVAFGFISRAFDDPSVDVRNAAARALYDFQADRAASFTRALREGSPERRRSIGAALASSDLAANAIANLTGESREKTYDAFSLLFLMAKAGEVQPLMEAIDEHPNVEVRLAVVKLLALSGQPEIVPTFRRLAVRGSLPPEVRSAVMEAIYQISSQGQETTPSAA